jgi:CRP/FNR family transcriptional regulator
VTVVTQHDIFFVGAGRLGASIRSAMITAQLSVAYPFLGKISPRSRSLVEAQGILRVFKHGEAVIRKGERVGGMFLIVSGCARVFMLTEAGEETTLYTVKRGESCLLSTSALFAEMCFPASVEVETEEVKIFCIPAPAWRTLYRDEAAVRDFTVTELSGRVFDLLAALEERSLRSIEDRLKGYLARRVDAQGEVEATHEQIALSLGTAREVVSRKLGKLGKAGWIETQRGRIRVLKAKKLA